MNKNDKNNSILLICSYYAPYKSGLTFVAVKLAEKLVEKGFNVTVLCHKHEQDLFEFEEINGVKVHRARPLFKLNRATFSIDFFRKFYKLRRDIRFINLHLPMPEAGFLSPEKHQKVITTYQCDVPKNKWSMTILSFFMDFSSKRAIKKSSKVVFSSLDYKNSSRMKNKTKTKGLEIFPFVNEATTADPLFKNEFGRNFGYLGRFTSEKGVLLLVHAFKKAASNEDRLLLAGNTKVAGDSIFHEVQSHSDGDKRILLYPNILDEDLPSFYASLDAFCFPSLNSFEAFGIAQVEAILRGIPVIVSNLPGVRVPVQLTGMGEILPAGCQDEWIRIIRDFQRNSYPKSISKDQQNLFSNEKAIKKYLELFTK